jgi:hypothetical protein
MMTEPTDPAALSDEVATAIAWLRDHAATDDFGRDFSRNKRHGAIADLLTRLSARVTEAERERDEAREQRDAALKVQNWVDNNSDRAIAAEWWRFDPADDPQVQAALAALHHGR